MKRFFSLTILCTVLLSFTSLTYSQRRRPESDRLIERFSVNRSLFFNYDLYIYAGSKPDSAQLYFISTITNDLLQFVKQSDTLYTAHFELSILMSDKEKKPVLMRTFRKGIPATHFGETNSRTILHRYLYTFSLPVGTTYNLRLELTDLDTKKSLEREKEIEIPNLYEKRVYLSQPVIVKNVLQPDEIPIISLDRSVSSNPIFISDSCSILSPLQIGEFSHYRIISPVELIQEIYQNTTNDSVCLTYQLQDRDSTIQWTQTKILDNQNRFIQKIEIDPQPYPPGFYILNIIAKKGNAEQRMQLRFFFHRKMKRVLKTNQEIDELGPLKYIMDDDTYEQISSLPAARLHSALKKYWDEKDPSPTKPRNELRQEFIRRVWFANLNFISLIENREGWETDQGRVYIINGPPDEIMHPRSPNSQYQHEVWVYHKPGLNRRFIFYFKPENGEYWLLHGE